MKETYWTVMMLRRLWVVAWVFIHHFIFRPQPCRRPTMTCSQSEELYLSFWWSTRRVQFSWLPSRTGRHFYKTVKRCLENAWEWTVEYRSSLCWYLLRLHFTVNAPCLISPGYCGILWPLHSGSASRLAPEKSTDHLGLSLVSPTPPCLNFFLKC